MSNPNPFPTPEPGAAEREAEQAALEKRALDPNDPYTGEHTDDARGGEDE
jgi:hypothetical protein